MNGDKTVYFAKTNFRDENRIFGVKQNDRRQHTYVVGKTGTGKSVLLKNLAYQDIMNGDGVAVVDPHGELVEDILGMIPPHRVNDVIYFNPSDMDYPIGFNVLEVPDPKYKHVVASDLMGIFTKIWANVWSARMEYIMQNCIMGLLDTPGTTLLGIPRLLVDREYRAKIIANIKDPVVRAFWTQEYENYTDRLRSEAIVPIQNKVGQFLNTSLVRNIVGQPKSTFSVQEAMNSQKILLVNVSKGRIGEDNSALLGAMLITKLQLAAMERVRIPEKDRTDFYLYVDEFQNFATDSFASVLSEARKYRLNLIVAHQYINQLVTDVSTKVRDAIFGNVGTMLCFRVGAADAEYLETEFTPEFVPEDLVNLPNYHIYLKLMVDGVTSRPFSATTLPPVSGKSLEETKAKVIKVSRERYARPRDAIEERIMRWSGMGAGGGETTDEDGVGDWIASSGTANPGAAGSAASKPGPMSGAFGQKEEFEARCTSCGKSIKVPFEPDPRRPVYCPNCLKRVKEGEVLPVSMPRSAASLSNDRPAKTPSRSSHDPLAALGIEFAQTMAKSSPVGQQQRGTARDSGGGVARTPMRPLAAVAEAPVRKDQFETQCSRCGRITSVNFPPDGKRPVYCKLCLPIIRSEEMRKPNAPFGAVVERRNLERRPVRSDGSARRSMDRFAAPMPHVPLRAAAMPRAMSLKDALAQDGTSFSGKKLKKKEVDLTSLREALQETVAEADVPDVPSPHDESDTRPHIAAHHDAAETKKSGILSPGQKITF
ncbi:MAG: type IV secretion system DNA-binding domain-containing protein [bacterium]|nr:type IV secretion system DNA-binding domain-containing protein [bacterium]